MTPKAKALGKFGQAEKHVKNFEHLRALKKGGKGGTTSEILAKNSENE